MEKENKPRVRLTEWAPFIRNEYQRQVNPEMTGHGTKPKKEIDDPEGSAEGHKKYVRKLFGDYVAVLGMSDEEECFKGGKDKNGKIISNNSYSFWEEDKDLVIELLNIEEKRKGGLISNGEFKDCILDDLEKIIEKLSYLFGKYNPLLKETDVKSIMSRISGFGIRKQMEELVRKIKHLLLDVCLEDIRIKESKGGMDYDDFLYWAKKMMKELEDTLENYRIIYNDIQQNRMKEYEGKMERFLDNLDLQESMELNFYLDVFSQKSEKLGVNVQSDASDIPLISNKDDVKAARNMKEMKQNISDIMHSEVVNNFVGEIFCNRQPIEEIFNNVFENNDKE